MNIEIQQVARDAAKKIERKARTVKDINDVISIGAVMDELKKSFPSTKLRGQYIQQNLPELAELDSPFRSNSRWVYRTHIGKEDADILEVMGVRSFSELPYTHPTVLRQRYRERKAALGNVVTE
ncbi:hypothetical protein [Rhodobacter sp. CZR27]|uniref:hypothetical protein n=1 Tax=Rhodobacter sp. CZR27 TaxID=2033869 RepID=UPI0012FE4222|nr:hypothetical protein [Rhodobacter sp. CZR27]